MRTYTTKDIESMIKKQVPQWIVKRTTENINKYWMCLADAFEEAVKSYPKLKDGSTLYKAWYTSDFREYIPTEYKAEYLNFEKYPLAY